MNSRVEEEQKRLIATTAGVCMAEKIISNGDAERNANDEKPPRMLHFTTTDEILSEIGLLNPHSIFIMLSMAFLWCLSAMPTMSPAYMSPPTPCLQNCTFITVQDEFQLKRTIVDPAEMTSSVYFLGNLVLGQMYCMAADRIGRRPVLVWSLLVSGLAGVLAAFASNFYLMLFCRFIQGSFFNSITMINWVMCCESIAFKGHSYASVLFGVFWVAGYCLITPIAIQFESWRAVQFTTSFPTLLFGVVMLILGEPVSDEWSNQLAIRVGIGLAGRLFGIFSKAGLLPESFGFLITKRRATQAKKWIQRANRWGGSNFDCDVLKTIENETARVPEEKNLTETLYHVFHCPKLVLYMGIQTILWVVDFMVYNSLSLTATDVIKGSADKSFLFSGLVELPCYFIMPVALDRLGRKPTVIISHMLSSVSLLIMCFLSADSHPTVYLCIWLFAKFGMASAFMCCFVYGAEIFPVQYRNICLGFCATLSNVGAMMSPHCNILDQIFNGLMFATFAALCAFCGFITTFLPETKTSH